MVGCNGVRAFSIAVLALSLVLSNMSNKFGGGLG